MRLPARAAAGAIVVAAVLAVFLARPARLADIDSQVCDVITSWAGPGTASGKIVLVAIDEESLSGFGRWPWSRELVGRLVHGILDHGSSEVVLDMMFPQNEGASDDALANTLRGKPIAGGYTMRFDTAASGRVCETPALPLAVAGPDTSQRAAFFHAAGVICGAPIIDDAAVARGFLNAAPDHDGVMRRVPLIIESGGRYYPSLALAALRLFRPGGSLELVTDGGGARLMRVGSQMIPVEGPSLLRMRFRGGARTFSRVSASDVLAGRITDDLMRGKIAIVGGTAPGIENPVVTPVAPLFPGLEVQATTLDNLIQGDSFERPANATFWELILTAIAGTLSTWLLIRLPAVWGSLASACLAAAAWGACALLLQSEHLLYSPLPVTVALACNVPALTLLNYVKERKRADQAQQKLTAVMQRSLDALRESHARYQRLVDNVNDAIILEDADGRLKFANRRFHEWFGLGDAEIGTVVLERYVAPEWCAEVRDRYRRLLRRDAVPHHFEFEGVRPDGTRIWIEALVTLVEEDGRIAGTQAALRDTTERKRIEEQYLQARKMESVGRLAGGVAHDFNNLLTVIISYSDVLLDRFMLSDPSRRPMQEIRKAADQAADLTKKLLAFSRKQLVQPGPVNLNLIVNESERMLQRLIGEDVELSTRLEPDLGYVVADPGQLHQVLMNLIVNARDAMPQGGRIIVETRNVEAETDPAAAIYLGVTDFGTGMSDEIKQHLFEPFFTTKDPGKGTGLGLATVYGIVQQIGGRIEVASELGKGTTFHIYLPRVAAPVLKAPVDRVANVELTGSETVIVVEDQEAVRELATTVLRRYGYRVLEASNGPDAIALSERYPNIIHLLVTDIIMPLMDGRVLAEKLKGVRPEMKVLYVSGYSEEKLGRSRAMDPDLAYLPKPFTPELLGAKVREILAESSNNKPRTASSD